VTTHTALEAVGELVKPHETYIDVTAAIRYRVIAPCLLRQLADSVATGMEVGAAGARGSRSPLNVDAFDLWYDIVGNTYGWAENVGVSRIDPFGGQHRIPWPGRLLRTTASTALGKGFGDLVDRIEHDARRWAGQIHALVTGRPETRGVRGAQCPECEARRVDEVRPGEGLVRVPAIVLTVREIDDGVLRWVTCLACGWNVPLNDDTPAVVVWSAACRRRSSVATMTPLATSVPGSWWGLRALRHLGGAP
jgi:hypothetical protein